MPRPGPPEEAPGELPGLGWALRAVEAQQAETRAFTEKHISRLQNAMEDNMKLLEDKLSDLMYTLERTSRTASERRRRPSTFARAVQEELQQLEPEPAPPSSLETSPPDTSGASTSAGTNADAIASVIIVGAGDKGNDKAGKSKIESNAAKRIAALLSDNGELQDESRYYCTSRKFINGPFNLTIGMLILMNSLTIFMQMQGEGCKAAIRLGTSSTCNIDGSETIFVVLEHIFNWIFTMELIFRVAVGRCAFFKGWSNLLDVLIVSVALVRSYVLPFMPTSPDGSKDNMAFVRLIRIAMMVRTLRVVRIMELFRQLRVLMRTIASSFLSLMWSMTILGILMLVGALFLCQALHEFIIEDSNDYETRVWVNDNYGTASKSLYTMFEFTFSGCWPNYARPVIDKVSPYYAIFFVIYVAAVVFAITRIITALFLKETLQVAANDADMMVQEQLRDKALTAEKFRGVFEAADTSGDGMLSFEEFEALLSRPKVSAWLAVLGLDAKEASSLFYLLDDGDGGIDSEEFVEGMMGLKGYAREMDVIQIKHECRKLGRQCEGLDDKLESLLGAVAPACKRPDGGLVGKQGSVASRGRGPRR